MTWLRYLDQLFIEAIPEWSITSLCQGHIASLSKVDNTLDIIYSPRYLKHIGQMTYHSHVHSQILYLVSKQPVLPVSNWQTGLKYRFPLYHIPCPVPNFCVCHERLMRSYWRLKITLKIVLGQFLSKEKPSVLLTASPVGIGLGTCWDKSWHEAFVHCKKKFPDIMFSRGWVSMQSNRSGIHLFCTIKWAPGVGQALGSRHPCL